MFKPLFAEHQKAQPTKNQNHLIAKMFNIVWSLAGGVILNKFRNSIQMEAEKLSKFSKENNDIEINIPNFQIRSHQLYKSIVYQFRNMYFDVESMS